MCFDLVYCFYDVGVGMGEYVYYYCWFVVELGGLVGILLVIVDVGYVFELDYVVIVLGFDD